MFRGAQQFSRQIGLLVPPPKPRNALLTKALGLDVPPVSKVAFCRQQEMAVLACLLSVAYIAIQMPGHTLHFPLRELFVPARALSKCNGARDTIFSGTCAAPATLR